MDDSNYNPPTVSQAFGATDQIRPSTWSSMPNENSRPKPSAKIKGLIGRLGLRYHPTNSTDLASHQAMLVLLAGDVASIPPELLERAIDRHVTASPYMPKAADLIRLAKDLSEQARSPNATMKPGDQFTWSTQERTYTLRRTDRPYVYDLCDAYNAARPFSSPFVNYVDTSGNIRLRGKHEGEQSQ